VRLWHLQIAVLAGLAALFIMAKQVRPKLPDNMKPMCEHPAGPVEAEACSTFSR
jgi:hypothetical protein